MKKIAVLIFLTYIFTSCLEPIDSSTYGEHDNNLVVDGYISNEPGPYNINLSYIKKNLTDPTEYIDDAVVKIIDSSEAEVFLVQVGNGNYITPQDFRGIIGQSYKLTITIRNPYRYYESDFCTVKEPSCIDNIYLAKNETIDEIANETNTALSFKIDASVCSEEEAYLRWTVEEDWEFNLKHVLRFDMVGEDEFLYKDDFIYSCYLHNSIKQIKIHSFKNQVDSKILGKEVLSSVPQNSNRFTKRYRAIIKQHSISKDEFEYWKTLRESSEEVSDIFGKQPFTINSNIKCINEPSEKVLGYFQVSGITEKEIYVSPQNIRSLDLSNFRTKACVPDTIFPSLSLTFYEQYQRLLSNPGRLFYEPLYDEMGMSVIGLLYTTPTCAKCESHKASKYPPENWIEKK